MKTTQKIHDTIKADHFVILTADNPARETKKTQTLWSLKDWIHKRLKEECSVVKGNFEGTREIGFIVRRELAPDELEAFFAIFGQRCILSSSSGLVWDDGSVNPRIPEEDKIGDPYTITENYSEYYNPITMAGPMRFQLGIKFEEDE